MTLLEIKGMWEEGGKMAILFIIILLSLVQIAPLKINPWSWIFKTIGKWINEDVVKKLDTQRKEIDSVKADLVQIQKELNESRATSSRYRILRFDDELLHDVKHTKEHFDQILLDIDVYEDFCIKHPDFKNNLAVMAIRHIKLTYEKCSNEQSFL